MIYIIILILISIILLFIYKKNNIKKNYISTTHSINQNEVQYDEEDNNCTLVPYKKKYLLTKNEWVFYKNLKPVADKYNLHIIAKIRLADLVEVDKAQTKEFNKYFAKIKSKHIDFALAKPENLEIKYLIELDDNSHNNQGRKKRDIFLNKICEKTGYEIIRTYGDVSIIEKTISKKEST